MSEHRFRPPIESVLDRPQVEVMDPGEQRIELLGGDLKDMIAEILTRMARGQPVSRDQKQVALAMINNVYPKLAVSQSSKPGHDFAAQLEATIRRSERSREVTWSPSKGDREETNG